MRTYLDQKLNQAIQPTTLSNPLAKSVGAGALSLGAAATLGTVIVVAGGIGGGLLGAKYGAKHKTGLTIAGTLLGAFVAPMIISPLLMAMSTPSAPAAPAPQNGG